MRNKLLLTILLSLLLFSILNFPSVKAESQNYYVNISPLEDYYVKGETVNIHVTTNSSTFQLQLYLPSGKIWLNQSYPANTTQKFNIPSNAPYGTYTVKAVVKNSIATAWFSLLDISNWNPTIFPYSREHKEVNYTFYSDGTFRVVSKSGNFTLNFGMLKKLAKEYGLTVSATYNSMNFRVRFYKAGTDINVNLVWSFIWKGCKFIASGTIDKSRLFTMNVSNYIGTFKNLVHKLKVGNLVFDWTDLVRNKHVFSYDKETKILTVNVPKNFTLDPYIFEDGFESGDFSAWTGTYESNSTEGDLSVQTSIKHSGSYAADVSIHYVDAWWIDAYFYKDLSSTYTELYARAYFYFSGTLPADLIGLILALRTATYPYEIANVGVLANGGGWRLRYSDNGTLTSSTYSETVQTGTWYCIEIYGKLGNGDGVVKLWRNGTEIISVSGIINNDIGEISQVRAGVDNGYRGTYHVYVDDVIVDTSYIGSGGNNAPSIGEFQAPSTVYANQWFYLNASVNDADGISEIVNATIELSNSVVLKWDNASATFSEQSDTNNYCTLNASACIETEKNNTAFKLSWKLKLNNYPSGSVNILSSNTKVWDSTESGNNSETGLFTFSYITLNLQARDSSGTNLPRSVTFSGTLGNGTTFTKTSNTNGLATLTTCYGTHTVQVKWGAHLVKSSTSFSVTSNKTQNFDTTIARLNSGNYYVLISINQTTPATPEVNGLPNWKMYGISGSGQKDLKVDVANWVDTSQPSIIKVMGNPYETGWNWDGTNKILSGFTLDFDANPSLNLEMEWGTSSGGPGGSSGGSNIVPVTPEEEPEKPQDTINPPVYIIPEYQQPTIPADAITTIVVGSCIVVCIGLVINWLFEQNSTSKLWNRKSKKPKWKK